MTIRRQPEEGDQWHRRNEELEFLGDEECRLTTLFDSGADGWQPAMGTVFSIVPKLDIQLLTLEFQTMFGVQKQQDYPVRVYYKQGRLVEGTGESSSMIFAQDWTMLAESMARIAPSSEGAIVPASDFSAVQLQAQVEYSFYIHADMESLLVSKPASRLVGETVIDNGVVALKAGRSLDSGPFPATGLGEPSEFTGKLHYQVIQPCVNSTTMSTVALEFAVNTKVNDAVFNDISNMVWRAFMALTILNVDLVRFAKLHRMEMVDAETTYAGRNGNDCPETFDSCDLVTATVTFEHLLSISEGDLRLEILDSASIVAESVISQSEYEMTYIGDPISREEFVVSLQTEGEEEETQMNIVQRRYFERVTHHFLSQTFLLPIHKVEVLDTTSIEQPTSSGDWSISAGKRRRLRRSTSRQASTGSSSSELAVVVRVSGTGDNRKIRTDVLETIGTNTTLFMEELDYQQLQPGEINTEKFGALFQRLTAISIGLRPMDVIVGTTNSRGQLSQAERMTRLWVGLCVTGIVISVIWLAITIYRNSCYSPKVNMRKVSKQPRSRSRDSLDSQKDLGASDNGGNTSGSMQNGTNGVSDAMSNSSLDGRPRSLPRKSSFFVPSKTSSRQGPPLPSLNTRSDDTRGQDPRSTGPKRYNSFQSTDGRMQKSKTNLSGKRGRGIQSSHSLPITRVSRTSTKSKAKARESALEAPPDIISLAACSETTRKPKTSKGPAIPKKKKNGTKQKTKLSGDIPRIKKSKKSKKARPISGSSKAEPNSHPQKVTPPKIKKPPSRSASAPTKGLPKKPRSANFASGARGLQPMPVHQEGEDEDDYDAELAKEDVESRKPQSMPVLLSYESDSDLSYSMKMRSSRSYRSTQSSFDSSDDSEESASAGPQGSSTEDNLTIGTPKPGVVSSTASGAEAPILEQSLVMQDSCRRPLSSHAEVTSVQEESSRNHILLRDMVKHDSDDSEC